MIHGNVELHNVAEVRPEAGGGVLLQRVPAAVRAHLNPHAQERILDATCTEIRFVIEEGPASVTLRSPSGQAQAHVFFGDFQAGQTANIGAEAVAIPIQTPDWFLALGRAQLGKTAFSHRVCRLYLSGGQVCLLGVEGKVRPPRPAEVPSLRYLAYGTSITQGAGSSLRHLCYAAQTARRLGADLINLGVSSSAFCEKELADYVGARDDWDVATIEPTANMQGFPLPEFEERVGYWARALLRKELPRHVACITLMPLAADMGPPHQSRRLKATPAEHREAMRRVVQSLAHPRLHVIEGPELLPDLNGLGPDMIHPKDYGHTIIGENLARALRAFV